MDYRILAINPGSTSTKISVYANEQPLFTTHVPHPDRDLASFERVADQMEFRSSQVEEALAANRVDKESLSAVVGRGGMLPPVKAGGYRVNRAMKDLILSGRLPEHASNLGALMADRIAAPLGIPAFIYDAVSADELTEIARITGIPEIRRQSFCHVLNSKAAARKYAALTERRYEDLNLLVAHLGGGFSISAHQMGRMIDTISDDGGPFAPERSGSVPLSYIVDLCYCGRYSKSEIMRKIRGSGGLKAHLGTSDVLEVEARIAARDENARLVYDAMGYQIAKGIGNLCTVFDGPIDAILLTGGVAHSTMLVRRVEERVRFIAPVVVLPGENEMESLTLGALRILRGKEKAREFKWSG